MARPLVSLKVKLELKPNGDMLYPDFNQIDQSIRKGLDWSKYLDIYGTGWHYDKVSGYQNDDPDSPIGTQWAMINVPADFADAAVELFPDSLVELNETETEDFFDNRAHFDAPIEKIDEGVLKSLELRKSAGMDVSVLEAKALDPNDPTPGIVKNPNRYWVDFKAKRGIIIGRK